MIIAGFIQFGLDWFDIGEVFGKIDRVSRGLWLFPIYLTLNVRVPLQYLHIKLGRVNKKFTLSVAAIIHTVICLGKIFI